MEELSLKEGLQNLFNFGEPWMIKNVDFNHKTKNVVVKIDYQKGFLFRCPECEKLCKVHDSNFKQIRHLDWFEFKCYLEIKIPRTKCDVHGIKTIINLPMMRNGSHYSFFFEKKLMGLIPHMSMSAIANELNETDTTLWRVFKHYIEKGIRYQIELKDVKRVCVDETAIKRGHHYMTIFTDYDTGEVIYVAEGRKKEVFELFYGWLWDNGGHPGKIELFSMDMSKSYKAGQSSYFAHSDVVFDRFHIKKALNEAVDKVRKQEVAEFETLKKTKYIWLKNECNLTDDQKEKLHNMLNDSSLNTAIAYKLKIEFDNLWSVPKYHIEEALQTWLTRAENTTIEPLIKFVTTIDNNYRGIINAIKLLVNNGISEGINSKIQAAKTKARGYPNFENFKNMVYFLGRSFQFKFHTF